MRKYYVDRRMLKSEHIKYSTSEVSIITTANSQIYNNIPREESVISLLSSYLGLNFDVLYAATDNRYADGDEIGLFISVPIALFSNYKLMTSSGKHLEDASHTNLVSLM